MDGDDDDDDEVGFAIRCYLWQIYRMMMKKKNYRMIQEFLFSERKRKGIFFLSGGVRMKNSCFFIIL